jgi:hypothetical protein
MRRITGPPKVRDFVIENPSVNDWLYTVWERLGLYESATNPSLNEIPEKQWIIHRNTTTGVISIWTRNGAVAYSVATSSAQPGTTVVSETAFGQAAAVGTALTFAREDHTHGTPPDPTIIAYAYGSFTVPDGKGKIQVKRLTLTGSQRVTLQGTGQLRIT